MRPRQKALPAAPKMFALPAPAGSSSQSKEPAPGSRNNRQRNGRGKGKAGGKGAGKCGRGVMSFEKIMDMGTSKAYIVASVVVPRASLTTSAIVCKRSSTDHLFPKGLKDRSQRIRGQPL